MAVEMIAVVHQNPLIRRRRDRGFQILRINVLTIGVEHFDMLQAGKLERAEPLVEQDAVARLEKDSSDGGGIVGAALLTPDIFDEVS